MQELAGRVAVVTGAASGIGRGLAEAFAAKKMRVVLADVESDALERAADELRRAGHEVEAVRTDVSVWEQVQDLAARARARFGTVHVLCNNAGVLTSGPAWEQTIDDWRWVLGVDLWSVIHGVKAFVPLMLEAGEPAHIVNTASVAGLVGYPRSAPYSAAKFGVIGLSEVLHHDLRAAGAPIHVSVLCPGSVPTRIAASARNRPGAEATVVDIETQRQPPPTALLPSDVARKVLDAIRTERFWVVTHPQYYDLLHAHTAGVVDGTAPEPPPTF